MSRKSTDQRKKGNAYSGEEEEVNTMLQAAQDELLLNLSLNSHMARGASHSSSSYLHPDLHRRFQALKSTKSSHASPPPPKTTDLKATPESDTSRSKIRNDNECGDDLFARFTALKGSIPLPSPSPPPSFDEQLKNPGKNQSEVDEDEVQKVIQWAIDAARLDPSPLSDTDDDNDRNSGTSDDDDEEEEEEEEEGKGKVQLKRK